LTAFQSVVGWRVVFGVVVGKIVCSLSPMDEELALADSVADPVEAHIHGFGSSLFDCFVADSGGTGVVGLDGSGWLWMAHVVEDGSEHGSLFAVVEQGGKFSFGGGREYWHEDG
jgi:hypothetical protein